MSPQKRAILQIKATGSTAGISARTLAALERKKHLGPDGQLTKRGEAFASGRLGGAIGERADLLFGKRRLSSARKKAPKALREATTRNPTPAGGKLAAKVYTVLEKAAGKGQALNLREVAERGKLAEDEAEKGMNSLLRNGLAHVAGRDLFGNVFFPGAKQHGLFENPSPGERIHGQHATAEQRKALGASHKKALAWFRKESLVDEPQLCRWEPPASFVMVGTIDAIEYTSDKFDAKSRRYRHEVTQKRRLFLSTDGTTLLVFPPFRITTRGIEG